MTHNKQVVVDNLVRLPYSPVKWDTLSPQSSVQQEDIVIDNFLGRKQSDCIYGLKEIILETIRLAYNKMMTNLGIYHLMT